MKLSVVIVGTLFSFVSAQTAASASSGSAAGSGSGGAIISVTAPLQGASYKAGDKAIISWINPSVEKISQIVLAKGGSNSLQPVSTIATNVPAASGSYTWNIPADTPPGSDYAFEFGTSPNLAFTGQFSITAGGGGGGSISSSSATNGASAGTNSSSSAVTPPGSGSSSSSPAAGSSSKPSSSGSSAAAQGSSSNAANSLAVGSAVVLGTSLAAFAQLF